MLHKTHKFLKNCIFLAAFAIQSHSFAQISEETVQKATKELDKIISGGMEKLSIPGVAYSVVFNGKIVHKACFGNSAVNFGKKIELNTLFPISSFTKNITAILVGALVDAGKISFSDKVRKYLPDFFVGSEDISKEMTIQDLISHRSGFKHFSGDSLWSSGYHKEKVVGSLKILQQKPGKFREEYGYQNIIFGIIGDVLEKATGELYEDLVQEYIFDKLEMTESSAIPVEFEESTLAYSKYRFRRLGHDIGKKGVFNGVFSCISSIFAHKNKNIAKNHSKYQDKVNVLPNIGFFHRFPATSGISLSCNDIGKWVAMLLNKGSYNGKQIVSRKTFDTITSKMVAIENVKDNNPIFAKERIPKNDRTYGMGIFSTLYGDNGKDNRGIMFHMGGIYGATSFFCVSLTDNLAIGVMCNFGGSAHTLFPQYMTYQFLDLCFGFTKIDWVQYELNNRSDIKKKQDINYNKIKESNMGPMAKIESYTGVYRSAIYGDIKVFTEGNDLFIDNGLRRAKIRHLNRDVFVFDSPDMMESYFDTVEYASFLGREENGGKVKSLYISCFDEGNNIFEKVE